MPIGIFLAQREFLVFCSVKVSLCEFLETFLNIEFFGAEEVSWNRDTSINIVCTAYKKRQGKILRFRSKILLKLNFKSEFNLWMQTNRIFFRNHSAIFAKSGYFFCNFQKRSGTNSPSLSLSLSTNI